MTGGVRVAAVAAVALLLLLCPPASAQPPLDRSGLDVVNKTKGNVTFAYRPSYVGGFEKFFPTIRRRREDWIECLYNGTLTSRGVGVAVALPDVCWLTFAFAAPTRARAAVVGVNATDRVAAALADAGFSLAGGGGGAATAMVDMSPIKFALPVPEGGNVNKAAYLVETRVELRTPDPAMLEDGYSRALEAAVASSRNGSFRAAGANYELSRARIDALFEEARQAAVRDMLANLLRYAADLGVALGPLDAFAPERRGEIQAGPDDDAASELATEGGGRPARLFGLVEVAADYQVCSGGFRPRTRWICIDEEGIDIDCPGNAS